MLINLSEERNEKLLLEWSGEITEKNSQNFCDVCNSVFHDHFDLDYMQRKYAANIYGKSLIAVLYKDNIPVAAEGAWRNDLNGRPSFQIGDTATLINMRKRGYNTNIAKALINEIKKFYPGALIYRFSAKASYRISGHLGFAQTYLYAHLYRGLTQDFIANIPVIDDVYVKNFFMNKKNVYTLRINTHEGGQFYLLNKRKFKRLISAGIFLGQVSDFLQDKFRELGRFNFLLYYSLKKRRMFGEKLVARISKFDLADCEQVMDFIPPIYKCDTNSLDFNGVNNMR